jgi:hypothetical protein
MKVFGYLSLVNPRECRLKKVEPEIRTSHAIVENPWESREYLNPGKRTGWTMGYFHGISPRKMVI